MKLLSGLPGAGGHAEAQAERPRLTLYTDYSATGYGAVLHPSPDRQSALNAMAIARRSPNMPHVLGVKRPARNHCVHQELCAILLATVRFKAQIRRTHVSFQTDSTGAAVIMARTLRRDSSSEAEKAAEAMMPGVKSAGLAGASPMPSQQMPAGQKGAWEARWQIAMRREKAQNDIEMEVGWLPRGKNKLADRLSRASEEQYKKLLPKKIQALLVSRGANDTAQKGKAPAKGKKDQSRAVK